MKSSELAQLTVVGSVVGVDWEDSCTFDGWHDEHMGDPYHTMVCRTWGEIVHNDSSHISVAGSVNTEGQRCQVMVIPKSAVTAVTVVVKARDGMIMNEV